MTKTLKTAFIISLFVFSFLSPILSVAQPRIIEPQATSSSNNNINNINSNNKLSAEQDNIDSFDVNPKSGRWDTTDTLTDDTIIDSNLRLISSTNDSTSESEYFAQRGLTASDSKYEYRYKTSYGDNQSSYARDVLGDSWDFEEGDTEGWARDSGVTSSDSVSNGILTIDVTGTSTSSLRYSHTVSQFTNIVYSSFSLLIKSSESDYTMRIQLYDSAGAFIVNSVSNTLSTSFQTITYDLTALTVKAGKTIGSIKIVFNTGSGNFDGTEFFYIDDISVTGSYDYATHSEGDIEDTWDFQDSNEYFYDTYGNVSDFNDGTTEDWVDAEGGSENVLSNAGTEYLKNVHTGLTGDTTPEIKRTGLSISASGTSGYDYLTFEFNSSVAVTTITIKDSGGLVVCTDSTGWSLGTWYLFTCDLDLDADWTGTETAIEIETTTASTASTMFFNMVYLYDTSLGDLDDWIPHGTGSLYVSPEGYLNMRTATTGQSMFRQPSLSIDTSIYRYLKLRVKTSDSGSLFYFRMGPSYADITTAMSLTTSFQTFVFDLSLDPDWTGTITELSSRFTTGPIGTIITVDYILLTSDSTENDIFSIGLYDQDNSQPLLNITQHYYDSDTFQWRVYLTDSQNNVVSYYYHDENESSTLAGYPAVDSDLYVSSYSAETDQWAKTGSTPYLGAVDGTNYISITNDTSNALSRWYSFADTSSSHTTSYATTLGAYILSTDGDGKDYIEWKIDTTGDNIAEYQGVFSGLVGGWNTLLISDMTTKTEINNARISLTHKKSGINNTIQLDAVRLNIVRATTEDAKSCFNVYCRLKVNYNVQTSELNIELKTDGNTRIFKLNYPDDFTSTGIIPQLFGHGKAPDIFFSSYTAYITSSETWIDYIDAKYKENEWKKTTDTTTGNWTTISAKSVRVQDDSYNTENLNHELNIPQLDSISGTIMISSTDNDLYAASEGFKAKFRLYTIDKASGDRTEIIEIYEQLQGSASYVSSQLFVSIGGVTIDVPSKDFNTKTEANPLVTYSMSLVKERSELNINLRFLYNSKNNTDYFDIQRNVSLSAISADYSQEFLIETVFGSTGILANIDVFSVQDITFIERGWFEDPIGAVGEVLGGIFGGLLQILFDFLATIVRGMLLAVAAIFVPILALLQSAVELAVSALGSLLEVALSALGTLLESAIDALQPLLSAISDVIDDVLSALGEIVDDIIEALIVALADIVDALMLLLSIIIDAVIAILSYALDALIDLVDTFFPGSADFIRSFNAVDLGSVIADIISLVTIILSVFSWALFLFLTYYIWFQPFVANDFEPGPSVTNLMHNAFATKQATVVTIPIPMNAFFLWIIFSIILGVFSWILPFAII